MARRLIFEVDGLMQGDWDWHSYIIYNERLRLYRIG
jgi:hypothetical protein